MIRLLVAFVMAVASFGAAACPSLTDLMDAHYGAGNWSKRTGSWTGSDIAPALESALFAMGEVCVDRGSWALRRPVSPAALAGGVVRGVSSQQSKIFYQAASGAPFHFTGEAGRTGGGIHGLAIVLEEGFGMSGATAIMLLGDSVHQPDQMMFSDIYITALGNSFWYAGFFADGRGRTHPQGVRVSNVSNLQVFRAHALGIWLANVVQWTMTNVGVYVGQGAGNSLYIAGGGTPLTNSTQVYLTGAAVMGDINITNVSGFSVGGVCGRIATMANAVNGMVMSMCPVVGAFGPGVHLVGR